MKTKQIKLPGPDNPISIQAKSTDILRIKDGILVEHWDVIQDEVTKEQSKSGNPMFGARFPT
jgi:predicted SnoaL-like aldol condensation-catalyzing enzyme